MKSSATRLWISSAVAAAVLALLWGGRWLSSRLDRDEGNPFEYDLSAFRRTDPALVHYRESGLIRLPGTGARALAVGPRDAIYAAGNDAIAVFDASGAQIASFPTDEPAGCLAVNAQGTVFAGMRDHVEVFGPDGALLSRWTGLGDSACLTAVDATPRAVFVADAGNRLVWRFDPEGRLLGTLEGHGPPERPGPFVIPSPYFDLRAAGDGTIWIAHPGRQKVERFTPQGEWLSGWGRASMETDGFSGCCNPVHIALTPDGAVATSEKGLARIKVYDPAGRLLSVVAGPEHFAPNTPPLDIAVDSAGRVLALDAPRGLIRVFTQTARARHAAEDVP